MCLYSIHEKHSKLRYKRFLHFSDDIRLIGWVDHKAFQVSLHPLFVGQSRANLSVCWTIASLNLLISLGVNIYWLIKFPVRSKRNSSILKNSTESLVLTLSSF